MNNKIAFLSLLVILGLVNWTIIAKEKHLANGDIVYLKLTPRDPRSLMQGDYMTLNFDVADEVYRALPKFKAQFSLRQRVKTPNGFVVLTMDEKKIGTYKEIFDNSTLSKDNILVRYRVRNGRVKFATNAYFFQEGQAKTYQQALYGQFRVNSKGDLLLTAMFDKDLIKLTPEIDSKN